MLRVHGRARWLAAASLSVLFLSGCQVIGKDPVTGSTSPAAGAASPTPSASPKPIPDKPAVVTFDKPAGYSEKTGYRILVPLHNKMDAQWIAPTGNTTGEIIAVVSYALGEDVTNSPEQELRDRVKGYATKVKAVSTTEPVKSTVAGHTALTQDIVQPNGTNQTVTYQSVFIFDGPYMVQLICQYVAQKDAILKACGTVRDSLKITAA